MLDQVLTVSAAKGGVGKSSTSVGIAGIAAETGYRVLLVDLDPQANATDDLGVKAEDNDQGAAIFEAASLNRPLKVVKGVRPNLDVAVGGPHLENLAKMSWSSIGRNPKTTIASIIEPIADAYDLVVIDTPPGDRFLREGALAAARFVIVPVRTDPASLKGITLIAEDFTRVRDVNPGIELLGVVLFGVNPSATALLREVREQIETDLHGIAPVFETPVRYMEAPAVQSRASGLLPHEYARDVVDTAPRWYERLRSPQPSAPQPPRTATTAHKLADDYVNLTREVLERMNARLDEDAADSVDAEATR